MGGTSISVRTTGSTTEMVLEVTDTEILSKAVNDQLKDVLKPMAIIGPKYAWYVERGVMGSSELMENGRLTRKGLGLLIKLREWADKKYPEKTSAERRKIAAGIVYKLANGEHTKPHPFMQAAVDEIRHQCLFNSAVYFGNGDLRYTTEALAKAIIERMKDKLKENDSVVTAYLMNHLGYAPADSLEYRDDIREMKIDGDEGGWRLE